mmetsp:Transcript_42840/g.93203  ORF Transcript_42840/g.93203 Transcript_42840/m.93203 type:complete len:235 (+) Transcript_42840:17-721(+)
MTSPMELALPGEGVLAELEVLAQPMSGEVPNRCDVNKLRSAVLDLAARIARVQEEEIVKLPIRLLSGAELGRVEVPRKAQVADVINEVHHLVEEGKAVSKLVFDGNILEESSSLTDAGLDYGAVLNVTFEPCAYRVQGAGREEVNGCYTKTSRVENGAPVFANRNGIILFRYIMRRGTPYWYFTQDGHPADDSKGDYYRVQTAAESPPSDGWNTKSCPRGDGTSCPQVLAMDGN